MASGRIARELQLINQESTLDPESNTSVEVYENDLYHWKASILGPVIYH
jgi:ubiquitin-protein ligase